MMVELRDVLEIVPEFDFVDYDELRERILEWNCSLPFHPDELMKGWCGFCGVGMGEDEE